MKTPRSIFIYGAGGAGRELACTLAANEDWRVCGFIDDTPEYSGRKIDAVPVLGGFRDFVGRSLPLAVCMVDKPSVKRAVVSRVKANGGFTFPVIVGSRTSFVAPGARIGEGCIISLPYNFISTGVDLGEFVFVNCSTRIGHDVRIGDYATIFSGIDIGGGVRIGKDCVIGSGSVINPRVSIGDGSVIGGGSVVVKDIPAGVVAAGCPAKVIREIKY